MKIAHSSKPSVSGFTLIELMIAVALLGILLTLAMPSFSDMIRRMRIESAANSLSVALATARSEAVKRGRNISVCKSANSSACTTSGDWSTGWVIYATAGTPIKAFDAPSGGLTMTGGGALVNVVSFQPTGAMAPDSSGVTQPGSIQVCKSGQTAKVVSVAVSGRVRVASGGACS